MMENRQRFRAWPLGGLLSAGTLRLRRSRLLWTACGALALAAVAHLVQSWHRLGYGAEPAVQAALLREGHMDERFFSLAAPAVALSAVVCLWELGAEHQDGAIRGKLTVGHRRRDVYLSALLLTVLTTTLLCLSVFLPGTLTILLTTGRFSVSWGAALARMAGLTLTGGAFAALFTLLGLNIPNRAASAIAAIGLTLALLISGSALVDRLAQPEGWTALAPGEDGAGGAPVEETHLNPNYLPEGPARDALRLLTDILPGGQVAALTRRDFESPALLAAGAAGWTVLVSGLGLLLFRRKDLK